MAKAKRGRGRPKLPDSERRVHMPLRVRPDTKARVTRLARLHGKSLGAIVDDAFRVPRHGEE